MKKNFIPFARLGFNREQSSLFGSQLRAVGSELRERFCRELECDTHALKLVLNEASALAWESGYPALVFPLLAEEKLTRHAHWKLRQRFLKAGSNQAA